jgi:hypothetical protein
MTPPRALRGDGFTSTSPAACGPGSAPRTAGSGTIRRKLFSPPNLGWATLQPHQLSVPGGGEFLSPGLLRVPEGLPPDAGCPRRETINRSLDSRATSGSMMTGSMLEGWGEGLSG